MISQLIGVLFELHRDYEINPFLRLKELQEVTKTTEPLETLAALRRMKDAKVHEQKKDTGKKKKVLLNDSDDTHETDTHAKSK